MSLQIVDNAIHFADIEIIIERYTPLKILFEKELANKIYFRAGDFKHSLLEIGISRVNRTIQSINLVLVRNVFLENKTINMQSGHINNGIPVCDISLWGDQQFYDILNDFSVYIGHSNVFIELTRSTVMYKIINENVVFGIDSHDNLCVIEIEDLTQDQITYLSEELRL